MTDVPQQQPAPPPAPEAAPEAEVTTPPRPSRLSGLGQMMTTLRLDAVYEKLPENTVRALITWIIVVPYMLIMWFSPDPKADQVPPALMSAAGLVSGFYLAGDSSKLMKAALSIAYTVLFVGMMYRFSWVPEAVNAQVTTVLGIYFARKYANATLPAAGAKPSA